MEATAFKRASTHTVRKTDKVDKRFPRQDTVLPYYVFSGEIGFSYYNILP